MLNRLLSLFKRQPKRELTLDHVYTFPTGEKLYTYNAKDYGKISSRHYRNIQEAVNYLMTFSMAKPQWVEAVLKMEESITFAMKESKSGKGIPGLAECLATLKDFRERAAGLKNANQTLLEYLFCTFYLIDDETETGYSEKHNDRKVELLRSDPLMADFFLTNLQENMKCFWPISEENTLNALAELIVERERIYLNFQQNLKERTLQSENSQQPSQSK